MVMACSSLHRRDDTLDLVQCPKTRQDYTCIYHYIIQEICLLVLISIYKPSAVQTYHSVKSKHVLKTKLLNTRYYSVIAHNVTLYTMLRKNLNACKPSNY